MQTNPSRAYLPVHRRDIIGALDHCKVVCSALAGENNFGIRFKLKKFCGSVKGCQVRLVICPGGNRGLRGWATEMLKAETRISRISTN